MNPVARIKRYFRYGFWTTVKLDWRVFRLRWRYGENFLCSESRLSN